MIKKDEIGMECSTHGRRGLHTEFLWERQKELDHQEDLDVGGRIILKWTLES
jgi:hypothetical protein